MKHLKLLLAIVGMLVFANVPAATKDFALHQAVLDEDIKLVKTLLTKGAAIDVIGSRKYGYGSALHLAVREGHLDITKLLLKRGAQVDVLDPDDFTPLHNAAWNGNLEMAQLLLDAGADIEASTYDGDTPLSLAQDNDQAQVTEFIHARIQASSSVDAKVESFPVSDTGVIDVTGTYSSEVTAESLRFPFKNPKNPEVMLVQKGNEITGSFREFGGEIWGRIEGETITFDYHAPKGEAWNTGKGKWTIKPGGNEITGSWFNTWRGTGKWNLTKIETTPPPSLTGTYVADITGEAALLRQVLRKYKSEGNREVKIVQNGNQITGKFDEGQGTIYGDIEGDTIRFEWTGWRGDYGKGKWTVNPGTNEIVGNFRSLVGAGTETGDGNWNLTKIETTPPPSLTGTYIADISGERLKRVISEPKFEVRIVQNGNQLTGSFRAWGKIGKIYGGIEGNKIEFEYLGLPGGNGRGKWTIKPGSNELVGTWESLSITDANGRLNLIRIE